ncbi:hypothetical protein NC651_012885 [Populus alba x Populus x berolinensis]|nr:hypothetical protein NC651_012885 [Populus alba x Populus x berolinensis]
MAIKRSFGDAAVCLNAHHKFRASKVFSFYNTDCAFEKIAALTAYHHHWWSLATCIIFLFDKLQQGP